MRALRIVIGVLILLAILPTVNAFTTSWTDVQEQASFNLLGGKANVYVEPSVKKQIDISMDVAGQLTPLSSKNGAQFFVMGADTFAGGVGSTTRCWWSRCYVREYPTNINLSDYISATNKEMRFKIYVSTSDVWNLPTSAWLKIGTLSYGINSPRVLEVLVHPDGTAEITDEKGVKKTTDVSGSNGVIKIRTKPGYRGDWHVNYVLKLVPLTPMLKKNEQVPDGINLKTGTDKVYAVSSDYFSKAYYRSGGKYNIRVVEVTTDGRDTAFHASMATYYDRWSTTLKYGYYTVNGIKVAGVGKGSANVKFVGNYASGKWEIEVYVNNKLVRTLSLSTDKIVVNFITEFYGSYSYFKYSKSVRVYADVSDKKYVILAEVPTVRDRDTKDRLISLGDFNPNTGTFKSLVNPSIFVYRTHTARGLELLPSTISFVPVRVDGSTLPKKDITYSAFKYDLFTNRYADSSIIGVRTSVLNGYAIVYFFGEGLNTVSIKPRQSDVRIEMYFPKTGDTVELGAGKHDISKYLEAGKLNPVVVVNKNRVPVKIKFSIIPDTPENTTTFSFTGDVVKRLSFDFYGHGTESLTYKDAKWVTGTYFTKSGLVANGAQNGGDYVVTHNITTANFSKIIVTVVEPGDKNAHLYDLFRGGGIREYWNQHTDPSPVEIYVDGQLLTLKKKNFDRNTTFKSFFWGVQAWGDAYTRYTGTINVDGGEHVVKIVSDNQGATYSIAVAFTPVQEIRGTAKNQLTKEIDNKELTSTTTVKAWKVIKYRVNSFYFNGWPTCYTYLSNYLKKYGSPNIIIDGEAKKVNYDYSLKYLTYKKRTWYKHRYVTGKEYRCTLTISGTVSENLGSGKHNVTISWDGGYSYDIRSDLKPYVVVTAPWNTTDIVTKGKSIQHSGQLVYGDFSFDVKPDILENIVRVTMNFFAKKTYIAENYQELFPAESTSVTMAWHTFADSEVGSRKFTALKISAGRIAKDEVNVSVKKMFGDPPTVKIVNPPADVAVKGKVEFKITASDDKEIRYIRLYINGKLVAEKMYLGSKTATLVYTQNMNVGTYNIKAVAIDSDMMKNETVLNLEVRTSVTLPRINSITIYGQDIYGVLRGGKYTAKFDGVPGGACLAVPSPYYTRSYHDVVVDVTPGDFPIAYVEFSSIDNLEDRTSVNPCTSANQNKPPSTGWGWYVSNRYDYDPPYQTTVQVWYPWGNWVGAQSQSITAKVCDIKGFCTWETVTFAGVQQDTTPPTVTILEPNNGDTVSGTQTIRVRAQDDLAVSSVSAYLDSISGTGLYSVGTFVFESGTKQDGIWNATFDFSSVPAGDYTLKVYAYDSQGNRGSDSITLYVRVSNVGGGGSTQTSTYDIIFTSVPSSITAGSKDTANYKVVISGTYSTTYPIEAYVDQNRVLSTTLGSLTRLPDGSFLGTVTIDATSLSVGQHTLTVALYDDTGVKLASNSTTFNVVSEPVNVEIVSTNVGSTCVDIDSQSAVTITYSASANSGLDSVTVYLNGRYYTSKNLGGLTSVTDTISISTTSLDYGQSYTVSLVVKAVSGSTNSSTVTFSTCQKVTQPQGCEYVNVYLRGLNSPYDMYIRGADNRWYKIGTVELTPLGKRVLSWTNPPAVSSVTPGQGMLRLYISGTSAGMLTTTSEEYIADAPSGIVSWAQSNANSADRAIDTTCPVKPSSGGGQSNYRNQMTVRLIESGIGTAPYYIVGGYSGAYYYLGNVYPNVGEASVWSANNPQSTTVPADAMANININGFDSYPVLGTYEWSGPSNPTRGTNPILTITNPTYRGYTWNVMQGYYVYVNAQ